jgi:hypothetical protein
MEVLSPPKQASPQKKKKPSDSREAVRRRLKRKREDPDLMLLVEDEIAKRVGGDGCLECRKHLTQTNETLQQNLVLAQTHMGLLRGKLELDRMYQNELAIYIRVVKTQI